MEDFKVKLNVEYLGDLQCEVKHGPSGTSFITDAPVDNRGKGEFISPTDLAGASIASCIATIMGIKAQDSGIDIKGMNIEVSKTMRNEPVRMIKSLDILITFPHRLSDKHFKILANVVKTCPVTRSISKEVEINFDFAFAE